MHKVPLSVFKVSTILMMSEHDEDLDDFPPFSPENINREAESMVGAYRAESTDQ